MHWWAAIKAFLFSKGRHKAVVEASEGDRAVNDVCLLLLADNEWDS